MKKFTALLLVVSLTFTLAACGNSGQDNTDGSSTDSYEASTEETSGVSQEPQENGEAAEATEPPDSVSEEQRKILVAYFSWADNAVLAEDVDAVSSPSVIPPGNVQQLAGWVQEETGADVFSIRVTDPYPSDWDECLERANQERGDNARPELVENVEDLSRYDTIFLGYPNWWGGHADDSLYLPGRV